VDRKIKNTDNTQSKHKPGKQTRKNKVKHNY